MTTQLIAIDLTSHNVSFTTHIIYTIDDYQCLFCRAVGTTIGPDGPYILLRNR
ncbi:hypothetical protein GW930_00490 [Candidatus Saccharibacteria bacterium]|nr:hypothetical protein [Candidatus Saccharibacteria bacterium]